MLLEGCTLEQATRIAEGVRQAIRDFRFVWGASTLSVGASIGIVQIGADTENVANVMSAADIACYAAKDAGRNRIHVYGADGVSHRHREMHWVSARHPRRRGRAAGAVLPADRRARPAPAAAPFHELTVRLRDDSGRTGAPGGIHPGGRALQRHVGDRPLGRSGGPSSLLRERLRQRAGAAAAGGEPLGHLPQRAVLRRLRAAERQEPEIAGALCFEITETAAVTSLSNARFLMGELKSRGAQFSLDDFGTGVSSFVYLKTLPVDFLKIDGQFIAHITQDPVNRSMVEAIGKVGRALGIATVAECVESEAVLAELKAIGIDYVQGFHLAQPLPIEQLP